jgi:hypothetical protein
VLGRSVLGIFPKRKEKHLLRGQIWVDASTFRIRRIEGVPARSPSFWLKDIRISLQFAELGGMWVPVTFDSIATVRFLGQYTLAGLTIRSLRVHIYCAEIAPCAIPMGDNLRMVASLDRNRLEQ